MKILMTLMGLEIGGAETHVVELSKALKKKGYEIVIASNGGVYQKELEENGIRHVKIPLHSKKPWLFVKSYLKLKRLFDKEHFDIVHAHARIPAFICGLLAKRYTFRFVTTAHWVFKITPLWKRLAKWGEKTIAVSDDIKDYLIENYSTWSDNISTTINGIDTDKFSKSIDWSDIKQEFALEDGKYRILYVSRMDEDRSAVAYMVAEAMPEILKIRPNAELIIVGDGNDFNNIKMHADRINQSVGKKVITLTGARVDINKFVAASDVFVGVSRSALEAMSAGIPVIIAGNEGYIGIFDESKFKISYDTNYCCRGCVASSTELILNDLKTIVGMSNDEINSIKEYNKSVISRFYSADRMAQDYADMYHSLTPLQHFKHGEVIINGYYGYKNTGDDALLQAIIKNIRSISPDTKITVLSASPKETAYRYSVNSIHRYNLFKIMSEMKRGKVFVSGGGSLLQDVTSTKSLVYYTSLMKLAKFFHLRIMVYANGFGPINKKTNLERVKKALAGADYISMREPSSAKALLEIMPNLNVKVTADPAFSLPCVNEKWEKKLLTKYAIVSEKKYFAISLREWQNNDSEIVQKIADYCNNLYRDYSYVPVFVSMQNSKDDTITQKVANRLNSEYVVIDKVTASELISILKNMTFAIGMRLHFLVFSAIANIPSIGISYDPKINSLIEYIGFDTPISSKDVNIETLRNLTDTLIANNNSISETLQTKVVEMNIKNKSDAEMVSHFIRE